jgi:hypothetical protein
VENQEVKKPVTVLMHVCVQVTGVIEVVVSPDGHGAQVTVKGTPRMLGDMFLVTPPGHLNPTAEQQSLFYQYGRERIMKAAYLEAQKSVAEHSASVTEGFVVPGNKEQH